MLGSPVPVLSPRYLVETMGMAVSGAVLGCSSHLCIRPVLSPLVTDSNSKVQYAPE